MAFPPNAPVTLATPPLSVLYVQYNDDDDLQAFVAAYNAAAAYYAAWFTNANLPIYTQLTGSLLDWVALGLYGFTRPTIEAVGVAALGPLNTAQLNTIVLNGYKAGTPSTFAQATDDLFQRIMTWHLYKGDGKVFTLKWLKRRVKRFLYGANGKDVNVADTSKISISISTDFVTIDLTRVNDVSMTLLQNFLYIVEGGLIELPPQFVFQVII